MTEKEWNRLTVEQRLEARTKQAELDRARARLRAERVAARRQREARLAAEQRRRIERLYAEARYGDIIECVVEGGIADFHPGWRRYQPAPFTLARGESKYVTFDDGGRGKERFWSQYSPDGQALTICYRDPGRHVRGCVSVGARSQDFQMGVERALDIDDVFRNARLVCAYRPGRGMPRFVVHQHNVEVRRVIHHYHHSRRPPVVRRVVEDHRWYAPPRARERVTTGTGRTYAPRSRIHRRSPPVDPATRPAESGGAATPDEAATPHLPSIPAVAPAEDTRNPAPRARRRAREVAAPESAVHDANPDANPGEDKAEKRTENAGSVRKSNRQCGKEKLRGKATGHRNGPDARAACGD